MSDASLMTLRIKDEATFAAIPSGTWDAIRYRSESLKMNTQTLLSDEMVGDRQKLDNFRINVSAAGDIQYRLSYLSHDHLIERALQSDTTWTASPNEFSGTGASDNGTAKITGTGVQSGFSAGDLVRYTYASLAPSFHTIVSLNTDEMVVSPAPNTQTSGSIVVTAAAVVTNGKTLVTLSAEKEFTDLTNTFTVLRGLGIERWTLDGDSQSLFGGAFTFAGKDEAETTSSAASSDNTPGAGNTVMNGSNHIKLFAEGGTALNLTGYSQEVQNPIRQRLEMGNLGATSLGSGTFQSGGSLELYFATQALMSKYHNFTKTDLFMVTEDPAGNAMGFFQPSVTLSDATRVAGGEDTDIMAAFQYVATKHPTLGFTMRVGRWAA